MYVAISENANVSLISSETILRNNTFDMQQYEMQLIYRSP